MSTLPHPKPYDWALLAALTIFWGSSYALTKLSLESFPPMTMVFVRLFIGGIIALAWAFALGRKVPPLRSAISAGITKEWLFFIAMAIVGNMAPFFLISWGQREVPSSLAGILVAIMPLATLAAAHVLITHERITLPRLAGYFMGFGGIVVLLGVDAILGIGNGAPLHQFAILAGALLYSANSLLVRFAPHQDPFMSAGIVSIVGAVIALPFALYLDQPWNIIPTGNAVFGLTMLSIMSTGLAGIVYYALIKSAGPTFMSLTNYLAPLFAVALGIFILAERPTLTAYAALGLILGGVAISQYKGLNYRGLNAKSRSPLSGKTPPAPKE